MKHYQSPTAAVLFAEPLDILTSSGISTDDLNLPDDVVVDSF